MLPTIRDAVLLMSGANDETGSARECGVPPRAIAEQSDGHASGRSFAWEEVSDQYADGLVDWIGGGYRELAAAPAGA